MAWTEQQWLHSSNNYCFIAQTLEGERIHYILLKQIVWCSYNVLRYKSFNLKTFLPNVSYGLHKYYPVSSRHIFALYCAGIPTQMSIQDNATRQ